MCLNFLSVLMGSATVGFSTAVLQWCFVGLLFWVFFFLVGFLFFLKHWVAMTDHAAAQQPPTTSPQKLPHQRHTGCPKAQSLSPKSHPARRSPLPSPWGGSRGGSCAGPGSSRGELQNCTPAWVCSLVALWGRSVTSRSKEKDNTKQKHRCKLNKWKARWGCR